MKKLFTFLSIAFALSASAQISIIRTDYGVIGDKVQFAVDTPAPSSLNSIIFLTGSNQTWNFSTSLTISKYDSNVFVSPSSIANPPASANLLVVSATSNQFENVDTNFVKIVLDQPSYNLTGLNLKILKFPFTNNSVLIDSMIYLKKGPLADFNLSILSALGYDSVKADIKAYDTTTCLGWGMINLPDTSCNVLKVKISGVSIINLSGHNLFTGWLNINSLATSFTGLQTYQRRLEYQWIGKNSKSYIVRALMDTNGLMVQSFTYRVKNIIIPNIKSVSPTSAQRGQTLNVTITGSNTHFTQGSNIGVSFRQGSSTLNVNSVTTLNDSTLIANITIYQSNSLGLYSLMITDPVYGNISLTNTFQVNTSTNLPSLVKATPSRIISSVPLNVTITGANTHFSQGSNSVNFIYQGSPTNTIIVNSKTVINDNTLICNVVFLAPVNGNYDIRLFNTVDGTLNLTGSFAIATGINEQQSILSSVNIYPNPANDVLNISFAQQTSSVNISIFDITGRLVKSVNTNKNNPSMDVSDLNNGIYFVIISGKDFTASRKIIINK